MFKTITRKDYPKWFISEKLEIKNSPISGLGVFAREYIPARELIEASPIIIFHRDTFDALTERDDFGVTRHVFLDYPFYWENEFSCIALGWGGLYNHSTNSPNAMWKTNHDGPSLDFYARCEIEPGEEILTRYLPVKNANKLWFVDDDDIKFGDSPPPSKNEHWRGIGKRVKNLWNGDE